MRGSWGVAPSSEGVAEEEVEVVMAPSVSDAPRAAMREKTDSRSF
jgi:hypothetical protein